MGQYNGPQVVVHFGGATVVELIHLGHSHPHGSVTVSPKQAIKGHILGVHGLHNSIGERVMRVSHLGHSQPHGSIITSSPSEQLIGRHVFGAQVGQSLHFGQVQLQRSCGSYPFSHAILGQTCGAQVGQIGSSLHFGQAQLHGSCGSYPFKQAINGQEWGAQVLLQGIGTHLSHLHLQGSFEITYPGAQSIIGQTGFIHFGHFSVVCGFDVVVLLIGTHFGHRHAQESVQVVSPGLHVIAGHSGSWVQSGHFVSNVVLI